MLGDAQGGALAEADGEPTGSGDGPVNGAPAANVGDAVVNSVETADGVASADAEAPAVVKADDSVEGAGDAGPPLACGHSETADAPGTVVAMTVGTATVDPLGTADPVAGDPGASPGVSARTRLNPPISKQAARSCRPTTPTLPLQQEVRV